jgi:hypothetical protein
MVEKKKLNVSVCRMKKEIRKDHATQKNSSTLGSASFLADSVPLQHDMPGPGSEYTAMELYGIVQTRRFLLLATADERMCLQSKIWIYFIEF